VVLLLVGRQQGLALPAQLAQLVGRLQGLALQPQSCAEQALACWLGSAAHAPKTTHAGLWKSRWTLPPRSRPAAMLRPARRRCKPFENGGGHR